MRPLLALALLVGCATPPPDEPDDDLVDLSADPDGDGLTTGEELAGYTILVDETGLWDNISLGADDPRTVRTITSDPEVADSDGDGLDDLEERIYATDARRGDTDGDGLLDVDELFRWGTSATSVDTDGDATGGNLSGTRTPLPELFDGAELQLEETNGVLHSGPNATSPTLSDTDGDGASDYYELLSPTRDPVVPERPEFDIALTPNTTIAMSLNVEWGESYENSSSYQTTQFDERSGARTTNAQIGGEVYGELEIWAGIKVEAEASVGISTNPFGFETKATAYGGIDYTVGASVNTSYAIGNSARSESRQALNRSNQDARFRQQRITGGRLAATFDVVNTGDMAFRLTDLALGVTRYDSAAGVQRPLTTLQAATPDVTLARGETVTLFFEDTDVPADRITEALADPSSLSFTPVAYGIERSEGVDLDYTDEDISLRTARVEVHYRDGERVIHHRASDIDRDESGEPLGFTVRELLQQVGIEAESRDTPAEVMVYEIDGIPTEHWTEEPEAWPDEVDPGDRWLKSGWFVVLEREAGSDKAPYDLLDTRVRAGERAVVVQVTDLDRDGLNSWQEGQLGTSDESIDSDGDGLTDVYELKVPVSVGWGPDGEILSRMDPGSTDADGDGLSDAFELDYYRPILYRGLDPLNPDTDGDGWSDLDEVLNHLPGRILNPLVYDFYSPPKLQCIESHVVHRDSNGVERRCRTVELWVTDEGFDLTKVEVEVYRNALYKPYVQDPIIEEFTARETFDTGVTGSWRWSEHTAYRAIISSPESCSVRGYVSLYLTDFDRERVGRSCGFGGEL